MAIDDKDELKMLEQLPVEVQDSLLCKFLFSKFIMKFSKFLRITKKNSGFNSVFMITRNYYTWKDQDYRGFMTGMLTSLEPRQELKHTIFADELDEVCEINFITKGQVVVGYEINKQKRYCIKFIDCVVIGAYECEFDKRSSHIYTALTNCEGLFIRKSNWSGLMNEFEQLGQQIKRNLLLDYLLNIRVKVATNKRKSLCMMQNRNDYQMIKISTSKDEAAHRAIITECLDQVYDIDEKILNEAGSICDEALKKIHDVNSKARDISQTVSTKQKLLVNYQQNLQVVKTK